MNGKMNFLLLLLGILAYTAVKGKTSPLVEIKPVVAFYPLAEMETTISLPLNAKIEQRIRRLVTRGKKGMELYLGRSTCYFPVIEAQLKEMGLPDELKFLTVVESGLKPTAVSNKGAAGLWQLMPGTAIDYGLRINGQVDERLDLSRSTEAALLFIQDLYRDFGDWALVVAAYNCGPVRVKEAIDRRKSRDFWKIKGLLPRQTRDYVEKFIAISYLMDYYSFYDLRPRYPDYNLQMTQTIKVYSKKSFAQVALESGVSVSLIRELNPAYLYEFIPARRDGNNLILPAIGIRPDFLPEGMQMPGQW